MRKALVLAIVAMALLATPALASDWPMAHGDQQHTSYSADALAPPLALAWSRAVGPGVTASPLIVNGTLYYSNATGNTFCAARLDTGRTLWSFQAGGPMESTPAYANGSIVLTAYDGYVYKLRAADGYVLWSEPLNTGIYSSPLIYDGKVFMGSDYSDFYALDFNTGQVAWTLKGKATQSSPAADAGKVFIGLLDGYVNALEPATGAIIWQYNTTSSIHSSPMIYNGTVYIAARDGNLYALDEGNGSLHWKADLGYKADTTPSLDPATGTIIAGTFGGYEFGVNAATGEILWASQYYGPIYSTVAIAGGTAYGCAQDGLLFALNVTDGSDRWEYDTKGETFASPALADGYLVIGNQAGQLFAFTAGTGTVTATPMPSSSPGSRASPTPFPGIAACLLACLAALALARGRR